MQVWLDCIGENPADNEAIGDIKYFPASSGFSSQYFPYLNQVFLPYRTYTRGYSLHT